MAPGAPIVLNRRLRDAEIIVRFPAVGWSPRL